MRTDPLHQVAGQLAGSGDVAAISMLLEVALRKLPPGYLPEALR